MNQFHFAKPLKGCLHLFNMTKTALLLTLALSLNVNATPAQRGRRARAVEKPPAQPSVLIAQRTQRVLAQLKSRPVRTHQDLSLKPQSASKQGFLNAIYGAKLVEASWATEMLSDKRIVAEILNREIGPEKAVQFYPKTLGLREFLVSHNFLEANGDIKRDQAEAIEAALYQDFPSGFIARAAVGVAPSETTQGLFKDTDQFMVELMKPGTALYQPSHATAAVSSHLLNGAVASGEAVVLQENLTASADAKHPLKHRYYQEVRIHTYEGDIVAGAIPARWVQQEMLKPEQMKAAEDFVQTFLRSLSPQITARQAWGVDVAVFDNGEMRINDIVTNHGKPVAWSSYLEQPRVIEAYARHLADTDDVHLAGVDGWLIDHGFANYFTYWQRRIEHSHGVGKVLAYLPPWP